MPPKLTVKQRKEKKRLARIAAISQETEEQRQNRLEKNRSSSQRYYAAMSESDLAGVRLHQARSIARKRKL